MSRKFEKSEKVRFKHVDFAGIVFYPRFLEMVNDLVEDWFEEELDRPFSKIHETNGIPTVDLKVQFKSPARIGDELLKSIWVKSIGKSSVVCNFSFLHKDNNVCLEGELTLVNVGLDKDKSTIKAMPFSEETLDKIRMFLID